MAEQVISKELEKKLTQEYGRLSFRDKLMLVYAVSETTQELKAQIEKMKNCPNCANDCIYCDKCNEEQDCDKCICATCENKSHWKMKE